MRTKLSICSFCIVIVMLFALSPNAFPYPPDRECFGGNKKQEIMKKDFRKIFDQLNLTSEQKQKLEENRIKYNKEANMLREEMRNKKELLREELAKPELDMNKITQIHNDLKAVLLKIEDHLLKRILEVRRILTPEQINKFHKRMGDFRKKNQGPYNYRRQ